MYKLHVYKIIDMYAYCGYNSHGIDVHHKTHNACQWVSLYNAPPLETITLCKNCFFCNGPDILGRC